MDITKTVHELESPLFSSSMFSSFSRFTHLIYPTALVSTQCFSTLPSIRSLLKPSPNIFVVMVPLLLPSAKALLPSGSAKSPPLPSRLSLGNTTLSSLAVSLHLALSTDYSLPRLTNYPSSLLLESLVMRQ